MVTRTFFQQVVHLAKCHLYRKRIVYAFLSIAMLPSIYKFTKHGGVPPQHICITPSETCLYTPTAQLRYMCPVDTFHTPHARARTFMETNYPKAQTFPKIATNQEAEAAYWGFTDISNVLLEIGKFASHTVADMEEKNSTWDTWRERTSERVGNFKNEDNYTILQDETLLETLMGFQVTAEEVRTSQLPDSRVKWEDSELGRKLEDAVHAAEVQHRMASIAVRMDLLACPEAKKVLLKAQPVTYDTVEKAMKEVQRGIQYGILQARDMSVPCVAKLVKDFERAFHLGSFKDRLDQLSRKIAHVQHERDSYYDSLEDWLDNWRPCPEVTCWQT